MNLLDKALLKLGPLGSHAHYAHGYFTYPKLGIVTSFKTFLSTDGKLNYPARKIVNQSFHIC